MLPSKYIHNLTTFHCLLGCRLVPASLSSHLLYCNGLLTGLLASRPASVKLLTQLLEWSLQSIWHITSLPCSRQKWLSVLLEYKPNLSMACRALIDPAPCYLSDLTIYHPSLINSAPPELASFLFLINTKHTVTAGPLHMLSLIFAWLTHFLPSGLCSNIPSLELSSPLPVPFFSIALTTTWCVIYSFVGLFIVCFPPR